MKPLVAVHFKTAVANQTNSQKPQALSKLPKKRGFFEDSLPKVKLSCIRSNDITLARSAKTLKTLESESTNSGGRNPESLTSLGNNRFGRKGSLNFMFRTFDSTPKKHGSKSEESTPLYRKRSMVDQNCASMKLKSHKTNHFAWGNSTINKLHLKCSYF